MSDHPLKAAIQREVSDKQCDVYLYAGVITRGACDQLIDSCPEEPKRDALLILCSFGGDAHAAYRLTRQLQERYKGLTLFIPTVCKSAGTLVAVGAHHIIMSPRGELGPLDVQVSEPDELWEHRSGLIPSQALEYIQEVAFAFFEESFLKLRARSESQIATRTAAEMASQLSNGLFEPLVGQIDPLRVADIRLSMRIAEEYGNRLRSSNVEEGTIRKLVYQYPSHGFVLDLQEARTLFKEVKLPTPAEAELAELVAPLADSVLGGTGPLEEPALAVHLSSEEFLALLDEEASADELQHVQSQESEEQSSLSEEEEEQLENPIPSEKSP